jgi:hypothetical protein
MLGVASKTTPTSSPGKEEEEEGKEAEEAEEGKEGYEGYEGVVEGGGEQEQEEVPRARVDVSDGSNALLAFVQVLCTLYTVLAVLTVLAVHCTRCTLYSLYTVRYTHCTLYASYTIHHAPTLYTIFSYTIHHMLQHCTRGVRSKKASAIYASPLTRAIETAFVGLQGHPTIQRKGIRLLSAAREVKTWSGMDTLGGHCEL